MGGLLGAGCNRSEAQQTSGPAVSSWQAPEQTSRSAQSLGVVSQGSRAEFKMDAPLEKISGEAVDAISGDISVDLQDLRKSTGLVRIDLDRLVLYQEKRAKETEDFGRRAMVEVQNQHAKAWLEIGPDAPPAVRENNRVVEFRLERIQKASTSEVARLTGAEREVDAELVGRLRVHGRAVDKTAKVQLLFRFTDATLESVRVRTLEPVPVDLAEHDIRPRDAFGKLAKMTLEAAGQKVARSAPVTFEFSVTPRRGGP
jgi:hypothetical protein